MTVDDCGYGRVARRGEVEDLLHVLGMAAGVEDDQAVRTFQDDCVSIRLRSGDERARKQRDAGRDVLRRNGNAAARHGKQHSQNSAHRRHAPR